MKTNWYIVIWSIAALASFGWSKALGLDPDLVLRQYGLSTSGPAFGLITYGLIHLRIEHLVTNLVLLLILGYVVQKQRGHGFAALVGLAGLVAAGLGHLFLSSRPELNLHGSSGMVAALLGSVVANRSIEASKYDAASLLKTLFWLGAAIMVVIQTTGSQASLPAHVSGLFAGIVMGSIRFKTVRA